MVVESAKAAHQQLLEMIFFARIGEELADVHPEDAREPGQEAEGRHPLRALQVCDVRSVYPDQLSESLLCEVLRFSEARERLADSRRDCLFVFRHQQEKTGESPAGQAIPTEGASGASCVARAASCGPGSFS